MAKLKTKVTGRAPQIDPDKVNKGIFVTLAVFGLSGSGLNIQRYNLISHEHAIVQTVIMHIRQ